MEKKTVHNPLDGSRPDHVFDMAQQISDEYVSIIIVHRDTPEHLNILLQSIVVTSINYNFEIIVVDNASTLKDSTDFLDDLEEQGEFKIVRNTENLWWSKAANQGVAATSKNSKYFIFMHSDVVILNPSWIDMLLNVADSQNSGLVGLQLHNYMIGDQRMDFVEEWCVMISRECWNDCGPFTEKLPLVGHAFIFSLAAQWANHKPQVVNNTLAHHYRVFGIDTSEYERLGEAAQSILPKIMSDLQQKARQQGNVS